MGLLLKRTKDKINIIPKEKNTSIPHFMLVKNFSAELLG